ncbi:MAG: metal ABC transporter substrate-binding protein [Actinobacteria bacterium]|nr:metal ABC transporter substrate-binding protein [Actinomycetota bacterium]
MVRRIVAAMALLVLAACSPDAGDDDGRVDVVASFFPLAELVRHVGGDDVVLHDLTPPGVEPHDFEPSSREVDRIEDADVVVTLGDGFQPAIEQASERATGHVAELIDVIPDRRPGDPHIWLDPTIMASLAVSIGELLAEVDPANAEAYRTRAAAYADELRALDAEYETRLTNCERRVIVTTHDAFGYLARRYGLEQQPLTGLSPEAEPDPKRLAELADLVRSRGVTTVFTEGTEESKAADALAREAGVRTAVLSTLELPVEGGYIGGMRANLAVLAEALGCR